MIIRISRAQWERIGASKGWLERAKSDDIFEMYGLAAKNYDALATLAAQRELTLGERRFFDTFTRMLHNDATPAEMKTSWREWMEERKAQ